MAINQIQVCITIPKIVKEKMKQFPNLNWSRIAAAAFVRAMEAKGIDGEELLLTARVERLEDLLGISSKGPPCE